MTSLIIRFGTAIKKHMPRRLCVALAGLSLVLGISATTAIGATPAHASGTHCAWVNPIRIFGRTIPLGSYCFSVNGSGLYVTGTLSSYNSGYVYSLSEHIDLFDNHGNDYYSYWDYSSSGTLYGAHAWSSGLHGWARAGSICGTLYSSGVQIARTCNSIHS